MPLRLLPACLIVLLMSAAGPAVAQPQPQPDPEPAIVVSGRGEVTVPPDRAIVSFGAVAESEEAAAAQVRVNEIMADTIEAITDLGIPRNKLSTSNLMLHPVYEHQKPMSSGGTPRIRAYRASYTLTVTVDKIEQAGEVIDAGLKSGVNQFQGVQFTLKDNSAARMEALKQAAADAKLKATTIAEAMGVTLGPIERIDEAGQYPQPPIPLRGARMMMAEAAADMATPIEAGELTINATLTVAYRIRN